MSRLSLLLSVSIIVFFLSSVTPASDSPALLNRIEGIVYDQDRNPVPEANVELLDELYSYLARTKTNSAGRFSFLGVSTGRFKVRVSALRSNLLSQTQDVQLVGLGRAGSDTANIEFYLQYDNREREKRTISSPDSIFVQEIPDKAKELYDKGIHDLSKNTDQAFAEFEEAVKIFPNYFDALLTLGTEYINRKQYTRGYPYLLKAIDINPRSSPAFYSLGYAFIQLDEIPAAVKAARASTIINPASSEAQLLYGIALRLNKNYDEAEKTLLKAKSLSKNPIAEIHWQLALLYNKIDRNQDAVKELEAYLKLQTDSKEKKKIEELISKLKGSAK